jgi:beta-N-acetylhexosaminidase
VSLCAAIFGVAGTQLSADERSFFRAAEPAGFILFARNCESPAQLRALTDALRDLAGQDRLPILIDQEGGRVARLKPPHWRRAPSAGAIGALANRDPDGAVLAARLSATLIGLELAAAGITVDCAPVLDLRVPGAHDVVGDRAFHGDPGIVARLGRAFAEGLLSAGVLPVIKHMPGHGRGGVDSHLEMPRVETSRAALGASDFRPFAALSDLPWGISAHVLYTDIDAERPGTLSPTVTREVIRGEIGFDGVLATDDLSMKALRGTLREIAAGAIAAGCDLALHCNGRIDEMEQVAAGAGALPAAGRERIARGWSRLGRVPPPEEPAEGMAARLDALLRVPAEA